MELSKSKMDFTVNCWRWERQKFVNMNKQKSYNYLIQCVDVMDRDSGVRPSQTTKPHSSYLLGRKVPKVHSHMVAKHGSHITRSWQQHFICCWVQSHLLHGEGPGTSRAQQCNASYHLPVAAMRAGGEQCLPLSPQLQNTDRLAGLECCLAIAAFSLAEWKRWTGSCGKCCNSYLVCSQ